MLSETVWERTNQNTSLNGESLPLNLSNRKAAAVVM